MHFDIYDFEGEGKVDCKFLGDLLRSLDLRPTNATVDKNGGTKRKGTIFVPLNFDCVNLIYENLGEKKLTLEEFLPIYSQVKKDKDVGAYEDFMEALKVYDKMENGTMMEGELGHILLSLGKFSLFK